MALMSTPTRDSFFDPPSDDQSTATLILGGERLECRLVEVSLGGFGVSVPRATAWTGEPIARLLTHDAAYPVRIIRQESQYTGFHLTLQRIQEQETAPDKPLGVTPRWIIHASRCCAIGLIAALAYCFVAAPGGSSGDARPVHPQDVANLWKWTFSSWWADGPGQSTSESELTALTAASSDSTGDLFEMPAISVSLTSNEHPTNTFTPTAPARRETSSPPSRASDVDPQARAIAVATRQAQIKSSLLTARRVPSWPANSTTLPWLFPVTEPDLSTSPAYRMSEAARNDLRLFESGLKSLPATTAQDATRSLRRALVATASAPGLAANFEGLPDVRLIRSDDAGVYFRLAGGTVEILRVIPRDSHEPATARSSSPTSSLAPQSVNR